jgi:hypothetical protein
MIGRRVATVDDLERAGDYTGPTDVAGYKEEPHERKMVWFLLPLHVGATRFDRPTRGSGLHGVTEPPWTFRECPDGSLEIRASIACGRHDVDPECEDCQAGRPHPERHGEYWHGFLDEGHVWRDA